MRILIFGGDGMLGHQLLRQFRTRHEVRGTLRLALAHYSKSVLLHRGNVFDDIDVRNFDRVQTAISQFRPEAVVNAVGIVKQRDTGSQSIPSIEINALFPHKLFSLCRAQSIRLIHISTDCVFSGRRGNYTEADVPDADDIYGRSKLLGEISEAPGITLRTSLVGRELSRKTSLLEWFLAQQSPVKGYRNAIFSGFTTIEMSHIIERVLLSAPGICGLYHVSSAAISKYDLLSLIRDKLGLATQILPDDDYRCNRSLDSSRFRQCLNYQPPSWETMIEQLANNAGN